MLLEEDVFYDEVQREWVARYQTLINDRPAWRTLNTFNTKNAAVWNLRHNLGFPKKTRRG